MQTLQQKTRKFVNNYHPDTHSLTALRFKIRFCVSGSLATMPEWAEWRHTAISESTRYFNTIASAPSEAARISNSSAI